MTLGGLVLKVLAWHRFSKSLGSNLVSSQIGSQ
jgi:hypothetical protein